MLLIPIWMFGMMAQSIYLSRLEQLPKKKLHFSSNLTLTKHLLWTHSAYFILTRKDSTRIGVKELEIENQTKE